VWILLFRGETEEVQLRPEYYPLPAGFIPQITVGKHEGSDIGGMWADTSQTSLTWRWQPPAGRAFVGELTWPTSYEAAEDHAAVLLNIAEASFIEGCVNRRAPASRASSANAWRLNDVRVEAIDELDDQVRRAFHDWKAVAPCRSRRAVRQP
jgi:hypothetical protein